jgi:hypothetical protein
LFCRFLYTSKQSKPNWWSQLGFRALRAHQQPLFSTVKKVRVFLYEVINQF